MKKLQKALGISADGIYGNGTRQAVIDYQNANDLEADGMAGPSTLASMDDFSDFTEETVARAEIKPEDELFDGEDMPEFKGSEPVKGSAVATAPEKSLWGKVKGWFSPS